MSIDAAKHRGLGKAYLDKFLDLGRVQSIHGSTESMKTRLCGSMSAQQAPVEAILERVHTNDEEDGAQG